MRFDLDEMVAEALKARERAYAPYSGFRVGAALATGDGRIFMGCNVENLSLGLTLCAERNAVAAAVCEGFQEFVAIAVAAESRRPISPCGACRQVLVEFGDFPVISVTLSGERYETSVGELLPRGKTGILDRE